MESTLYLCLYYPDDKKKLKLAPFVFLLIIILYVEDSLVEDEIILEIDYFSEGNKSWIVIYAIKVRVSI